MAQGVKQTTRDVTMRFFQKFRFIKYVTAARKRNKPVFRNPHSAMAAAADFW
jgi:hypothetical protein